MKLHRGLWTALACSASFTFPGCGAGGGGDFATAPVRGTVTCQGVPLTSGTITFSPISDDTAGGNPGKPASGVVQADGSFVLSTYESEDGAIIGHHEVTYAPPEAGEGGDEPDEDEESDAAPLAAAAPLGDEHPCRFGGRAEAEVVDGDNQLTIDLAGWTPGAGESDADPEETGE